MSDPREHERERDEELELDVQKVQDLELDERDTDAVRGGGCAKSLSD